MFSPPLLTQGSASLLLQTTPILGDPLLIFPAFSSLSSRKDLTRVLNIQARRQIKSLLINVRTIFLLGKPINLGVRNDFCTVRSEGRNGVRLILQDLQRKLEHTAGINRWQVTPQLRSTWYLDHDKNYFYSTSGEPGYKELRHSQNPFTSNASSALVLCSPGRHPQAHYFLYKS